MFILNGQKISNDYRINSQNAVDDKFDLNSTWYGIKHINGKAPQNYPKAFGYAQAQTSNCASSSYNYSCLYEILRIHLLYQNISPKRQHIYTVLIVCDAFNIYNTSVILRL